MICGIDLGSRSVKIVLMDGNKLVHSAVFETVQFYRRFGQAIDGELRVDFKGLGFTQAEQIVATGYGRNTLAIAGAIIIPELKAHMLGAGFQTGLMDFTLLDLGGQDSKVVKVRNGKMVDFQTNDKCAASTGRYLENMAAVLNITLEELGHFSDNPVQLNATCAIFGESELIGRIVEGYSTAELAAGVNHSILKRIKPMLSALKSPTIVFTGGVAFGTALAGMIEATLSSSVIVPSHPQLNGAIGCAVYGLNLSN